MSQPNRMKVLVTGGRGFIGRAVVKKLLAAGDIVMVTSRYPEKVVGKFPEEVKTIGWDGRNIEAITSALEEVDAVIHLLGEDIDARWTAEKKRIIRESRVESTRAITEACRRARKRPEVYLQASGVGYYGTQGDRELDEASPAGNDFLARVCVEWEKASEPLEELGIRRVITRFGVVLSAKGRALAKMIPPFKLFLGGTLGSGKQWMSWISREDAASAIVFLLKHPGAKGICNLTAPNPVTNREFTEILARALNRAVFITIPSFFLRLLFGEMADVVLLNGQRAVPKRLIELGFHFQHPTLQEALQFTLKKEIGKGE